jgi:hypothetical protein
MSTKWLTHCEMGAQSHGAFLAGRAIEKEKLSMRKPAVAVGVLAVAGLIALNASAFTGTSLKSNAGSSQFVGGTVSQSLTGATLSSIVYSFGDAPANTMVHSVALTFADVNSDGRTPTVELTGSAAVVFNCTEIAVTTHLSTCTTSGADIGVNSIEITVP